MKGCVLCAENNIVRYISSTESIHVNLQICWKHILLFANLWKLEHFYQFALCYWYCASPIVRIVDVISTNVINTHIGDKVMLQIH